MTMSLPHCIVITGATSGIGRALALNYAGAGMVLGLVGRNAARMAEIAEACRAKGASVDVALIDVRDKAAMAEFLTGFDRKNPVDLVVASAGVNIGTATDGSLENADKALDLIHINICGVLNAVQPLLPAMRARRSGQIGIVSSLSAFTPLPDAPAYSASKAALVSYAKALREKLRGEGVSVNAICPGFVTTPLSLSYRGWKPFEISAMDAAVRIRRGLAADRRIIAFPLPLTLVAYSLGLVPEILGRICLKLFRFTVVDQRAQL